MALKNQGLAPSSRGDTISWTWGETGQASTRIKDAAKELSQQSESLRTQVDRLIARIRAGWS